MPRHCTPFITSLLLATSAPAAAAQFVVNTIADAGPGSLRQAIISANAAAGTDEIVFAIPGTGPHTIALQTALPVIAGPTRIDGYTQPGASPNTLDAGWDAQVRIEIDAFAAPQGVGLRVQSTAVGSEIRGLAILNVRGVSVQVEADDAVVAGNIVGLRADAASPNQIGHNFLFGGQGAVVAFRQEFVPSARRIRIGGPDPADRNLIAGVSNGISASANSFTDPSFTGIEDVLIQNNWIGLDGSGLRVVGVGDSITLQRTLRASVRDNLMVSPTLEHLGPFAGNGDGISAEFRNTETTVQANRVGVDPIGDGILSGWIPFGANGGISFGNASVTQAMVGHATDPALGNVVSYTSAPGMRVFSGARRVNLANNRFVGTGVGLGGGSGMAIDLELPTGPNTNDPLDADTGSNDQQNHPLLTAATQEAGGTRVAGTLSSAPTRNFRIEFHGAPSCPSNRRSQVMRPLAETTVATNAAGEAAFEATVSPAPAGWSVAASATDPEGNTSELGPCIAIAGDPGPGTLELSAPRYPVVEFGPTVNVVVRRIGGSVGNIGVRLRSEGGTATPDVDHAAIDTLLQWADGDASERLVPIEVLDDTIADPGEYFGLRLQLPTGGAVLGTIGGAVVVIGDDLPDQIFRDGFEPGSPP